MIFTWWTPIPWRGPLWAPALFSRHVAATVVCTREKRRGCKPCQWRGPMQSVFYPDGGGRFWCPDLTVEHGAAHCTVRQGGSLATVPCGKGFGGVGDQIEERATRRWRSGLAAAHWAGGGEYRRLGPWIQRRRGKEGCGAWTLFPRTGFISERGDLVMSVSQIPLFSWFTKGLDLTVGEQTMARNIKRPVPVSSRYIRSKTRETSKLLVFCTTTSVTSPGFSLERDQWAPISPRRVHYTTTCLLHNFYIWGTAHCAVFRSAVDSFVLDSWKNNALIRVYFPISNTEGVWRQPSAKLDTPAASVQYCTLWTPFCNWRQRTARSGWENILNIKCILFAVRKRRLFYYIPCLAEQKLFHNIELWNMFIYLPHFTMRKPFNTSKTTVLFNSVRWLFPNYSYLENGTLVCCQV